LEKNILRDSGCNSAPLGILKNNPYFRDFLNPGSVDKCLLKEGNYRLSEFKALKSFAEN
jgi:hypothetical protein